MKKIVLNGIFPVYKPTDITSAQFLEIIKNKLRQRRPGYDVIKMGHGGTLDKTASGVLVVGINKSCSKLPAFLGGEKAYKAVCFFGKSTDTYNSEGQITMEKPYSHINEEMIGNALSRFHGTKMQTPPVYSALKKDGVRFSDLARGGFEVKPQPRPAHCFQTSILEFCPPKLTFSLICGGGFYVRSMVHELGLMLNSCAHIDHLERTQQGPLTLEHCLQKDQLTPILIHEKINQLKPLVETYIDVQMEQFRSKSNAWEFRE